MRRNGFIISCSHHRRLHVPKFRKHFPYMIYIQFAGYLISKIRLLTGGEIERLEILMKNYAKISRIAKNELFMSFSPQQR